MGELRALRRAILIRLLPSADVALSNANIEKLGEELCGNYTLRRRTAKQCRRKHLLVSWQRAHLPTLSIRTSEALVNRPLGCEAIGRAVSSMSAVVSISSATPSYPTGAILHFILLDPVREALLKPFYALSGAEVNSAKAYLHKNGKRATLTELQALTGNKLHAWSNEGCAGRICIPYGESRYWKLDGINSRVRANVKTQAHIEGLKTAQWVERALEQALQKKLWIKTTILPISLPSGDIRQAFYCMLQL